jgi:hypothetical protein
MEGDHGRNKSASKVKRNLQADWEKETAKAYNYFITVKNPSLGKFLKRKYVEDEDEEEAAKEEKFEPAVKKFFNKESPYAMGCDEKMPSRQRNRVHHFGVPDNYVEDRKYARVSARYQFRSNDDCEDYLSALDKKFLKMALNDAHFVMFA